MTAAQAWAPGSRELARAAERAVRRADATGRVQWLVWRGVAPARDALELFAASEATDRFYWEHPEEGLQIFAAGSAHAIQAQGAQRFAHVATAARTLREDVHVAGDAPAGGREPLLVGGFAFADEHAAADEWRGFEPALWQLPSRVFLRTDAGAVQRVAVAARPGASVAALLAQCGEPLPERAPPATAEPEVPELHARGDAPFASYRAGVDSALRGIAEGELEKVVLARSLRLERRVPFDAATVLDRLRSRHPACVSFAVARGEATLVGATPELLLRLEGRRLHTAALAGSAPRGRSPQEDERLARELVESKKEQSEHAIVARALREGLSPLCSELVQPEAPRLRRLDGIQHLETPVDATLREAASLLELAPRLHPTPAVGGAPRAVALDWIARNEVQPRGWYAGPVGFVNDAGGGELRVALRCALLRGASARLFAGAGIVAGSRPESELRETQLKLAAMLNALVDL